MPGAPIAPGAPITQAQQTCAATLGVSPEQCDANGIFKSQAAQLPVIRLNILFDENTWDDMDDKGSTEKEFARAMLEELPNLDADQWPEFKIDKWENTN